MDSVQEIKNKLSIEDVVAPYVSLKKRGKYLKACCPFHQEKTPSFIVSTDRQMAYCFGCQKGGDIFQFIQDIEGLDFKGALEFLADKAGVTLEKGGTGPSIPKDKKDALRNINRDASKLFVQQLWGDGAGEKVLLYLRNRGMTDETIKEFRVGFAPDGKDTLYRHLLEKKYKKELILESSLAISRDAEGNQVFDRFRLRLMFPIQNANGDFVAFGGRALKKGDNPKYLNSPEYVLYNKSSILYNLNRAKEDVRKEDLAVFVEGYFDVMASFQAGVKNVVATSGTALTDKQFKLIKRYTKNVALAFDSDNAGQDALLRAIETAQALELEIFVVEISGGKDTADIVKEDSEKWRKAVNEKKPYLKFFMEKFQAKYDLGLPTGKKSFTDEMFEILKGVSHPVLKDHYLKEVSKLVGTPVDMLYDLLAKVQSDERKHRKLAGVESLKPKKSRKARLVSYFLGLLLVYPKMFFDLWEELTSYESFLKNAETLGLVKQISKLNEEDIGIFRNSFPEFLKELDFEIDATKVYKRVIDHYNLRGEITEAFYDGLENSDLLHKIALEADNENNDEKLIPEEFRKLITLLYLEFVTSK
ncbi:DNA primase [Patescibacteria group bacterium]|nr:DNA primase [Patescibacteria group bacterium]